VSKKIGIVLGLVVLVIAVVYGGKMISPQVKHDAMESESKQKMYMEGDTSHEMGGVPRMHQHAQPDEAKLVAEISKGGYVLFMRHERTELEKTADVEPTIYSDCSAQRDLSPTGVASAKELRVALKTIGIPVAKAFSSPYCRTMKTAEYAFGSTISTQKLSGRATNTDEFDMMKAGMFLKEFLSTIEPVSGKNIGIVGHWGNFNSAFGKHLHEGDMAVLQKKGSDYVYVGTIHPSTWSDVIHDAERMKMMMH